MRLYSFSFKRFIIMVIKFTPLSSLNLAVATKNNPAKQEKEKSEYHEYSDKLKFRNIKTIERQEYDKTYMDTLNKEKKECPVCYHTIGCNENFKMKNTSNTQPMIITGKNTMSRVSFRINKTEKELNENIKINTPNNKDYHVSENGIVNSVIMIGNKIILQPIKIKNIITGKIITVKQEQLTLA